MLVIGPKEDLSQVSIISHVCDSQNCNENMTKEIGCMSDIYHFPI